MNVTPRFLETTRGEVLRRLLGSGPLTARELADAFAISPNAVRQHLTNLERDGYIEARARRETGGKPAVAYGPTAAGENLFPRGYAAVLAAMVDEAVVQGGEPEAGAGLDPFLESVGLRLARATAGVPAKAATEDRLAAGVAALADLGAVADVTLEDGVHVVRGRSCPLADVVEGRPDLCGMLAVMLEEIVRLPVRENCRRDGPRPCCGFVIGESAAP